MVLAASSLQHSQSDIRRNDNRQAQEFASHCGSFSHLDESIIGLGETFRCTSNHHLTLKTTHVDVRVLFRRGNSCWKMPEVSKYELRFGHLGIVIWLGRVVLLFTPPSDKVIP